MMDVLATSDLERLLNGNGGPCVSFFMPTHAAGQETQQDPVRLKNLIAKAEQLLVERGMRPPVARDLMAPLRERLVDTGFWAQRGRGLAIFASPRVVHCFRLPLDFDEVVVVADRFYVKRLLPLFGPDDRFLVLVLSQKQSRLLEASQYDVTPVAVKDMPPDSKTALQLDGADRGSQVHSGARAGMGKQGAVFHGQGGQPDTAKEELEQYLRLVESAVRPVLNGRRQPLVLAGVDHVLTTFRRITSHPHVLAEELRGNFDHISDREIREKAWPLVERKRDAQRSKAAAKYCRLVGTGDASDDASQILPAAFGGRVESLFVDWRGQEYGKFDPATHCVERHPEPTAESEDLVEVAVAETVKRGGAVYAVDRTQMPSDAPLAAVFRF